MVCLQGTQVLLSHRALERNPSSTCFASFCLGGAFHKEMPELYEGRTPDLFAALNDLRIEFGLEDDPYMRPACGPLPGIHLLQDHQTQQGACIPS